MVKRCPHQFFQQGLRASTSKSRFNLDKVVIKEKQNTTTRIAHLVLQAVADNRRRHDTLQRFLLTNDGVTVATEVPIYLLPEDIAHMRRRLQFDLPIDLDGVLTGHIDFLQIRNGAVHILDYKPQAHKDKPIEQLTLYALALSRLTFEFFPLHIVYKK